MTLPLPPVNRTLCAALAALLLLPSASLSAANATDACRARDIFGTWVVTATQFTDSPAGSPEVTTCWFVISRNRPGVANLRIECEPAYASFFGLPIQAHGAPWHQLEGPLTASSGMVAHPWFGPDTRRRFATPNRCEWRIVDRNGIDDTYTIWLAPDHQTLQGHGEGNLGDENVGWVHYITTIMGVKQ